MKKLICVISVFLGLTITAGAQKDDFGMWYELGLEKKLSKEWNISMEGEFRTRNNTKTADRWSAGVSAEYKIAKGLKASAGYNILFDNNPEDLTWNSSNDPKKWTPSYWGTRHRFNVSMTGSVDWGRLKLSLRERWQYTYRPEAKDKKYAFTYDDNDYLSGYRLDPVNSKNKHMLRSRLQASYDIAHWKFDPTASAEMFTDKKGIQKMRYQIGIDYKVRKQHVFSLSYRYQAVNSGDDDNDVNSHLIGLGYKYKF